MEHTVVLGLFEDGGNVAEAARALRAAGVPWNKVSIVARSHDEEGSLARATDTSPGVEFEDSAAASRLGAISAHLLAAISLFVPGVGPVVADGPLAAELGEAAGHLAGDMARLLERAGLSAAEAAVWHGRIQAGAYLVGAHVPDVEARRVHDIIERHGADLVMVGHWRE